MTKVHLVTRFPGHHEVGTRSQCGRNDWEVGAILFDDEFAWLPLRVRCQACERQAFPGVIPSDADDDLYETAVEVIVLAIARLGDRMREADPALNVEPALLLRRRLKRRRAA